MPSNLIPPKKVLRATLALFALLPAASFSETKPIMTTDLLRDLSPTEPWDKTP